MPADGVIVGIHAPDVYYINKDVEYTVTLANAVNVLDVELAFEVDGNMLASKSLTGLNGFGTTDVIHWTYLNDDVWKGVITLCYLPGNNLTGFTSTNPADIARIVFTPKAEGEAALVLKSASANGVNGDEVVCLDATIEPDTATTVIELVYSKYDLNRDGKVDSLDLGIMLLYCGFDKDDPRWDTMVKVNDTKGMGVTAGMCDVNRDGLIDMLDLIDLFIHYGVPSDPGPVEPDAEISYGIVEAWAPNFGLNDPRFRIVNMDEDTVTYYIVGKMIKWHETTYGAWAGTKIPPTGDFASVNAFVDYVSGKDIVGALAGYKLNRNNQITEMKTGFAMTGSYSLTIRSRTVARVNDRENSTTCDFSIDKDAAVFYRDSNGDYRTSTVANINLDETRNMSGSDISLLFSDDGRTVVAMLITEDAATPYTVYGVVNSSTVAVENGNRYSNLTGLFAWELMPSISTTTGYGTFDYDLTEVGLFEFKRDTTGKASGVAPVVPFEAGVTLAATSAVNLSNCYLKTEDGMYIVYDQDVALFEVDRSSTGNCRYKKSNGVNSIRNSSTVWAYATDEDYPDMATVIIWEPSSLPPQ